MEHYKKELFCYIMHQYWNNELTKEDIVNLYKEKFTDTDLVEALNSALNEKDGAAIYDICYMGFICDLFTIKTANVLRKSIKETWHNRHEDMAHILQTLKVPDCVDDIVTAMHIKCDYWYDEGDAFIRKCAYILGDLETPYAIQKLKELTTDDNEIIRKYASIQLKKIDDRNKK
jgi:HEAT repeat protein